MKLVKRPIMLIIDRDVKWPVKTQNRPKLSLKLARNCFFIRLNGDYESSPRNKPLESKPTCHTFSLNGPGLARNRCETSLNRLGPLNTFVINGKSIIGIFIF